MSDAEIRDIFSCFQNVNLLALRDDLRNGNVGRTQWIDDSLVGGDSRLCPLAHGWHKCLFSRDSPTWLRGFIAWSETNKLFGFDTHLFTNRWDSGRITYELLLSIVNEIIAERIADADTVQRVLEGELVTA